jgi:transposase
VDRLDNQVCPTIQTLSSNNDGVFQDDNAPIHTAETVQTWVEEHEGQLQHFPWPAKSPDLNTTEPLWSVLETRVKNRFPPPTSLKQLENVLQEEWHKILLETA